MEVHVRIRVHLATKKFDWNKYMRGVLIDSNLLSLFNSIATFSHSLSTNNRFVEFWIHLFHKTGLFCTSRINNSAKLFIVVVYTSCVRCDRKQTGLRLKACDRQTRRCRIARIANFDATVECTLFLCRRVCRSVGWYRFRHYATSKSRALFK